MPSVRQEFANTLCDIPRGKNLYEASAYPNLTAPDNINGGRDININRKMEEKVGNGIETEIHKELEKMNAKNRNSQGSAFNYFSR